MSCQQVALLRHPSLKCWILHRNTTDSLNLVSDQQSIKCGFYFSALFIHFFNSLNSRSNFWNIYCSYLSQLIDLTGYLTCSLPGGQSPSFSLLFVHLLFFYKLVWILSAIFYFSLLLFLVFFFLKSQFVLKSILFLLGHSTPS